MRPTGNKVLTLGLSLGALGLVACASVVPGEWRDQVRAVPFRVLGRNPERYAGSLLLLGGEIVALRPRGEWIEIDVLERPLGFRDRPRLDRPPRGRFAVLVRFQQDDERSDELRSGRLVTVVGEVQGRSGASAGLGPEGLPLLMARYLHLWPSPLFPGGPEVGIEFRYEGSVGF